MNQNLERLSTKRKKKTRDDDAIKQLSYRIDQHEWHVSQLDKCWSKIKDNLIDSSYLKEISDAVEYYITDAIGNDEFFDDEFVYEIFEQEINGNTGVFHYYDTIS